jgi:hypothetical protein
MTFITRDDLLFGVSKSVDRFSAQSDSTLKPQTSLFDEFSSDRTAIDQLSAFGANAREGFIPTALFDSLMNKSTLAQVYNERIRINYETPERAKIDYYPWEDPMFVELPQEWQQRYYDVQSRAETESIYKAYIARQKELQTRNEGSGIAKIGSLVGEIANPGGILSATMRVKKVKDAIGAVVLMTGDEFMLQTLQDERSSEISLMNVGNIGILSAGLVAGHKIAGAFKSRRYNATMDEIQKIEEAINADTLDDIAIQTGRVSTKIEEDAAAMSHVNSQRRAMEDDLNGPLDDELPGNAAGPQAGDAVPAGEAIDLPPSASRGAKVTPEGEELAPAYGFERLGDGPVKRILAKGSAIGKTIISELIEHPFYQRTNMREGASAVGVDRLVAVRWTTKMVGAMRDTEALYLRYRQRVSGSTAKTVVSQGLRDTFGGGRKGAMDFDEFLRAAGRAKRKLGDDVTGIEQEVLEAANNWHNKVYRPMGEDAKAHGLFSRELRDQVADKMEEYRALRAAGGDAEAMIGMREEIMALRTRIREIDSAEINPSYLNRIYRKDKIRANRAAFAAVLRRHGVGDEHISKTIDNILGDRPRVPEEELLGPGGDMLRASDLTGRAASLHSRSLAHISDEALQDFLEDNLFAVGKYYTTRVAPDVELMKKFGSISLAPQIRKIRAEWESKINAAKSIKEKEALRAGMESEIDDLKVVRDRLRGTYGLPDNPDTWTNRGLRVAKMYNATTMLTGAISAVPDMARLVMYDGLTRTFGTVYDAFAHDIRKILKGDGARTLTRLANDEAELAGEALDMYMSMRAAVFADLSDAMSSTTRFEHISAKATQQFFNVSLMNPWNVGVKTMASLITGSRMIDEAVKWASVGRNSAKATVSYGEVVSNRSGSRIAAKYNKKTNTVMLDQEKLVESFNNKAWANPKLNGVEAMPDDAFKSFADWRDFVIEHELAHADIRPNGVETVGQYENRINKAALNRAGSRGAPSTGYERSKLARAGIDENMAWRITMQFEEHGVRNGRVRIAKTSEWTDRAAAEAYTAALGKEINTIIVTPGLGELPSSMNGGLGKIFKETQAGLKVKVDAGQELSAAEKAQSLFLSPQMAQVLFQFKAFGASATQRILVPGLQHGDKNFLIGAAGAVGLGMLISMIRNEQLGRRDQSTPELIKDGINRSGVLGYFSDINGIVETFTDNRFGIGPLLGERERRSNGAYRAAALGGPSVSQVQNLSKIASALSDGHVTSREGTYLRRGLPANRVFWADGIFDGVEDMAVGAAK